LFQVEIFHASTNSYWHSLSSCLVFFQERREGRKSGVKKRKSNGEGRKILKSNAKRKFGMFFKNFPEKYPATLPSHPTFQINFLYNF